MVKNRCPRPEDVNRPFVIGAKAHERLCRLERWIDGQRREVAAELLKLPRQDLVLFCFALVNEGAPRELMALHALLEAESRWIK